MGAVVIRSSLEMMLDAIRQRDEQPKDLLLPALPLRPMSRGRLPTPRRLCVAHLKLGGSETGNLPNFVKLQGHVSCEVADTTKLLTVPSPTALVTDNTLDYSGKVLHGQDKVASLEDARNMNLQAILCVQKNYRAIRSQAHYQQLKKGAAILQSLVRGERTRQNFEVMMKKWKAAVIIQKHVKRWLTSNIYTGLRKDTITLQAVVRGERERHKFRVMIKRWSAAVIIQKHVKRWFTSNAYNGLRKDIVTLQAVVRGERARHNFEVMIKRWSAAIIIQKNVKQWLTSNAYTGLRKDIIILQAVIRGWLARKHFAVLKKQDESKFVHTLSEKREESKDTDGEHPWIYSSVVTELQCEMRKAAAALKEKEEGNVMFKKQLMEYEKIFSETTGHKQLTSTQTNLIIARKTSILEETLQHKLDVSKKDRFSESEDAGSVGAQTPGKLSAIPQKESESIHNAGLQHKKFDRGARVVDQGLLADMESWKEHQNPKPHLSSYKKELKMKIRKTKAALSKLINPDKKAFKRWCCIASPP
ncbi:myosin-2-like isoform X2 [Zingiber officinale]|uniref:myosin-2-like isoform X2 n=1 Tax=Zingiber officinale TaxID=94328 RepID=UPI001C4AB28C|nr:myosin-2-like isoform X2 [Zingiber officinale]